MSKARPLVFLRLIRRRPSAAYGIVTLLLFIIVQFFDLQYDSSGIGGIVVISMPIWGIVYWAPHELLFALNDGEAFLAADFCRNRPCHLSAVRRVYVRPEKETC